MAAAAQLLLSQPAGTMESTLAFGVSEALQPPFLSKPSAQDVQFAEGLHTASFTFKKYLIGLSGGVPIL
jgi:hypothetical protein